MFPLVGQQDKTKMETTPLWLVSWVCFGSMKLIYANCFYELPMSLHIQFTSIFGIYLGKILSLYAAKVGTKCDPSISLQRGQYFTQVKFPNC